MTTKGIKTMLHPVYDLEKANAVYTALIGIPRRPTATPTSVSRPSKLGSCRAVDRRA